MPKNFEDLIIVSMHKNFRSIRTLGKNFSKIAEVETMLSLTQRRMSNNDRYIGFMEKLLHVIDNMALKYLDNVVEIVHGRITSYILLYKQE